MIIVSTQCCINITYKHSNSLQFLANSTETADLKRLARFISIRQSVNGKWASVGLCVVRKVFHLIHVTREQVVRWVKLNPRLTVRSVTLPFVPWYDKRANPFFHLILNVYANKMHQVLSTHLRREFEIDIRLSRLYLFTLKTSLQTWSGRLQVKWHIAAEFTAHAVVIYHRLRFDLPLCPSALQYFI